jgi:hypothetical protein
MTTQEIYFWWIVWLVIGAVIVVAAAALLIGVIVAARRIRRLAIVALGVVDEIEQNTKPIWQLKTSLEVAGQLLGGAQAINGNATAVLNALVATESRKNAA